MPRFQSSTARPRRQAAGRLRGLVAPRARRVAARTAAESSTRPGSATRTSRPASEIVWFRCRPIPAGMREGGRRSAVAVEPHQVKSLSTNSRLYSRLCGAPPRPRSSQARQRVEGRSGEVHPRPAVPPHRADRSRARPRRQPRLPHGGGALVDAPLDRSVDPRRAAEHAPQLPTGDAVTGEEEAVEELAASGPAATGMTNSRRSRSWFSRGACISV
jgi:hypothetical protein